MKKLLFAMIAFVGLMLTTTGCSKKDEPNQNPLVGTRWKATPSYGANFILEFTSEKDVVLTPLTNDDPDDGTYTISNGVISFQGVEAWSSFAIKCKLIQGSIRAGSILDVEAEYTGNTKTTLVFKKQ